MHLLALFDKSKVIHFLDIRQRFVNTVDVESRISVVETLANNDFSFEQVVLFGLAKIEFQFEHLSRAAFIAKVHQPNLIRREIAFFGGQVHDATCNSYTFLHRCPKLFKRLNFELLFEDFLQLQKLVVHEISAVDGSQIKLVVRFDLIQHLDFNFCCFIVDSRNARNCIVVSCPVLSSALARGVRVLRVRVVLNAFALLESSLGHLAGLFGESQLFNQLEYFYRRFEVFVLLTFSSLRFWLLHWLAVFLCCLQ